MKHWKIYKSLGYWIIETGFSTSQYRADVYSKVSAVRSEIDRIEKRMTWRAQSNIYMQ